MSIDYLLSKFKVSALNATITVEADIKMAPTAGLSEKPIGANTPAAKGIAKKLYPAPHAKF